jgi:hypothetical protein
MKSVLLSAALILVLTQGALQAQFAAPAGAPLRDAQPAPSLFSSPDDQQLNIFLYKPRWGVGLQFGLLSGTGLAVRFHPESRFSAQLAAGGIKISESMLWSVGAEGQFDFDIMKDSRFYGLVALGYHSVKDSTEQKLDATFRVGFGIGYEWAISSKAVCFITLPFVYWVDAQNFYPFPQAGIIYYFR